MKSFCTIMIILLLSCTIYSQESVRPKSSTLPTEASPAPNNDLQKTEDNVKTDPPLVAYQKGHFKEAEAQFRRSLNTDPNNANLLYNWGLSLYQSGLKGQAVAAWRKAITVNPSFSKAREALAFATKHTEVIKRSLNTNNWTLFQNQILRKFTLNQFGILTLIGFLISSFILLKFFGRRKFALIEDKPLPAFPTIGSALALVTILLICLSGFKLVDNLQKRATIVAESVSVFSGPSRENNKLIELPEGMEVNVNLTKGKWTQITFSGGQSGWVATQELFFTSGATLW